MGHMMLLNSNLELSTDETELLQKSDPIQAASYETMHNIIDITDQIIDKNR